MDRLWQDLRFGLRSLRKAPGLAITAIVSLGAGIGANTIIFTWLNSFVLQPQPVIPHYDRTVIVKTAGPGGAEWSLSYLSLRDWRAATRTIELGAAGFLQLGLRQQGGPAERLWAVAATGNYFDALGVRPALGRLLTPRDEAERATVVVLGYAFWQQRFGGDSAVIGRHLVLNGQDLVVVGVAPPRFNSHLIALKMDVFVPLTLQPLLAPPNRLDARGWQWLDAFGRLKEGVSIETAREEVSGIAQRISRETGDEGSRNGALLQPVMDQPAARIVGPILRALLGITAIVLLIACANVANLLLARALGRRREIGIRLAVGASRTRLVRQLLTEGILLAAAASLLGILIAWWGRDLLLALMPAAPLPIDFNLALDGRVVAFAVGISAIAVLLFALVPALQASRAEPLPALRAGDASPRRFRLQHALVVAQVALALVALVSAGLFLRTLLAARATDIGMHAPSQVLLANTDFRLARIPDSLQVPTMQKLLETVRAVPGVETASLTNEVPFGFGGASSRTMNPEGYEPRPDENRSVEYVMVGPDYFRAMGMTLVSGRALTASDGPGQPRVMVVNEQFAKRYWPGLDPLGRRVNQNDAWYTVVGVARQGKYHTLTEDPVALAWMPLYQEPHADLALVVRSASPATLPAGLRRAFQSINGDLPFLDVRTLAQQMEAAVFAQRLGAAMLATFGGIALVLSGIGLYGVLAFGVRQRTKEIGIRVALGAARRQVVRGVVVNAVRLAAIGVIIGAAGAVAAGQLLRSLLIGVGPRDPLTFAAIAALLVLVAVAASWLPARRAARIDPMIALRSE